MKSSSKNYSQVSQLRFGALTQMNIFYIPALCGVYR
ncbi:hypothetical protein SAMN05216421_3215 [Halopseudomonas xinjiangensis]|uniref:Uncharacterized protein n=1 Tax=Halopseudomonas xinjiangensis TaxID=487184 RepID=A0A1H1YNJ3_9GAMM|nr:hypothetical protein SAMN05216421_3215 [Halopseudomonas xinjiangensis]